MRLRVGILVAMVAVVMATPAAYAGYSDLVTAISAEAPGETPTVRFYWNVVIQQDRFLVGRGDAGDVIQYGAGGYVTLEDPDVLLPSIGYGMGNINKVEITVNGVTTTLMTGGVTATGAETVDTNIKGAFGNLCIASETVLGTDTVAPVADCVGLDLLTGSVVPIDGIQLTDTNGDGFIMFRTDYNFATVGDYNRDGGVDSSPLTSAGVGSASDRPFVAMYETTDLVGGLIDINPTITLDADADGVGVDNAWVGNPYTSVDAVDPGLVYLGTPDADPNVQSMVGFADPLLVGEIVNLSLNNIINLTEGAQSNSFLVSTGVMDVKITDGRLMDYIASVSPYFDAGEVLAGLLNSSSLFTPGGDDLFNEYEWTGNGQVVVLPPPVAEPAALSVLLGGVAVALRRRRK